MLFVSHAGGDWQMYCHDGNHDIKNEQLFETTRELWMLLILIERDRPLHAMADLPVDTGRSGPPSQCVATL